jgi:hypothetical protein
MSLDSNFKNLSSQLGGTRLNGIVSQGTATNYNILTIDDPFVIVSPSGGGVTGPVGYLQVKIGNHGSTGPLADYTKPFYIPIYQ